MTLNIRLLIYIVIALSFHTVALRAERRIIAPSASLLPVVGITAMIQDSEGYVWYASTEGGLCRDNGYQVDIFRNDRDNPMRLGHSNGVLSICETSNGDICFGTRENIYLLRKSDYSIVPLDTTVVKGKVRLIRRTANGGLVAVTGSGVCTYDKAYRRVSTSPLVPNEGLIMDSASVLHGAFTDIRGRKWELVDGEPYICIPENMPLRRIDQDGVTGLVSLKSCVSTGGRLFKGDEDGISIYPCKNTKGTGKGNEVKRISGLSNIRQMVPAPDGGVYYISAHAALAYCSDEGKVTVLVKGGESKTICCMSPKNGGASTVWIGGWQGQVWRYNGRVGLILDEVASIGNSDPVNSLAADDKGVLWIVTDKAVKAYNPVSRQYRIIKNTNRNVRIRRFNTVCWNNGRIIVSGSDGILEINDCPETSHHNTVTLTGIVIDSISMQMPPGTKHVTVPSGATNVSLHFSTFDHLNASDVVMSYRINGGEWLHMESGENTVRLSALSKGTYRLEVRATDAMSWETAYTTVTLERLPAWWETWQAYLIYIVLLVLVIIVTDRAYVRYRDARCKIHELQTRIEEIMRDRAVRVETIPDEIAENGVDHEFMEKAIALVERHLNDSDYDVAQFAADLCMSRATLYRMFAATTGQKPMEFMRSIRLKRAEEMLRSDASVSVASVAAMTGFASVSNFTKRFRELFGVNPSQISRK